MTLTKFEPRNFEEILQDMVNYIRLTTPELTDFNVGSRIRTILEACALEDDEQYHQMVNLLNQFNLDSNIGIDLDERLEEYNISRKDAMTARGSVVFSDTTLVTGFANIGQIAGSTTLVLYNSESFPSSGTLRIGEGLTTVEDVLFSANNTATGTITLAAGLTNSHQKNERVSLVDGAADITISAGLQVSVPATDFTPEITATTTQSATISNGNYESGSTGAVMDTPGISGNIGVRQISRFPGSPPFDGAVVRNDTAFTGGRDEESDEQFIARGKDHLQSLSRSTPLALQQLVVGTSFTNTTTGVTDRVISAKVREDYKPNRAEDRVLLYIWPGKTGFVTTSTVTNEVLTSAAEDGQKFFDLANIAIEPGSLNLERQILGVGAYVKLVQGTDYFLNEARGQIQIVVNNGTGLNKDDALRATTYDHYTGLMLEVTKVVNGLEEDPVIFPGISAAGIKVQVQSPRTQTIPPIRLSIQVQKGYTESEVTPLVRDAIVQYIQELTIGQNLILAELVERSMSVQGMYNVQFKTPTQDVIVYDDAVLDIDNITIIIS